MARLGLSDPPGEAESLRRAAHFLRPRESWILWTAYSVMLALGLVFAVVMTFAQGHGVVSRAVARAHAEPTSEAVAAAGQAGADLAAMTAAMFMTVVFVALVWLVFIWAWGAISLRFGGRDRNVGLATRQVLRALQRPHSTTALARRRLLEATRRWAGCARRAGMRQDVRESVVAAVSSRASRTPAGVASLRSDLQQIAIAYDTGELLDGRVVMEQRSHTWAQMTRVLGVVSVAAVPPTVAALLAYGATRFVSGG
ncbi:hypothetical protein [Cellulomonas sp. Y8]|uniref:hypothetical protein n=1 Tax=Cellulomonas sp. Y8 TaxID=2591145 RepID=UPI0011CA380E|nr:hypothetical protein [Cellulomonas sp. Y8]